MLSLEAKVVAINLKHACMENKQSMLQDMVMFMWVLVLICRYVGIRGLTTKSKVYACKYYMHVQTLLV